LGATRFQIGPFCFKEKYEVRKLAGSPATYVFICDECVTLSADVLRRWITTCPQLADAHRLAKATVHNL
jgi:hypothetical protein